MKYFYDLCLFQDNTDKTLVQPELWELATDRFTSFCKNQINVSKPIPKVIHQIWLGSPVPDIYSDFIKSWKHYNKDWEYILWDDNKIKKLGLKNKVAYNLSPSYGIKSDIARYEILYRFGGIYVDTDFECLKNFEPIINGCSFFAGHSNGNKINIINAIIGSHSGNDFFEVILEYIKKPLLSTDGMKVINYSGPGLFTELFIQFLQKDKNTVLFPSLYFYPYPNYDLAKKLDIETIKRVYPSQESYAIHYWEASWLKNTFINTIKRTIKKLLGVHN
ncbi:MAG TPA: glycosyltransferase [Treponema sp.]|nr:glycosyltransferase [Treponema sp.]HRU29502.1 glycosyltransferase [Treponema sp.]